MSDPAITRHGGPTVGEYHARVEGAAQIGRLTWTRHGNVVRAEHTLVPAEIGGRGVAARLVEALVADARAGHFVIDPACNYVAAAFDRHPEWAELRA